MKKNKKLSTKKHKLVLNAFLPKRYPYSDMRKIKSPLFVFILNVIFLVLISGCGSHKKINSLAAEIDCQKTFHFTYNDASNKVPIDVTGPLVGKLGEVNYKEAFIKSLKKLSKDTKMELSYKDKWGLPFDSIVQVTVSITNLQWNLKTSSGILYADLEYRTPTGVINVVGENKLFLAGTNKGNLPKALKSGHYKFLKKYCDSL
ncbi:MAG: hypothetical protein AAF554_02240 [Bacteroidota bacterium]